MENSNADGNGNENEDGKEMERRVDIGNCIMYNENSGFYILYILEF